MGSQRRTFLVTAMTDGWAWVSELLDNWTRILVAAAVVGLPTAGLSYVLSPWIVLVAALLLVLVVFSEGSYRAWDRVMQERDRARTALGAALAEAVPLASARVERFTPIRQGSDLLLRLRVFNDDDRKATFYGQVVSLEGSPPWGPEPPWYLVWRHGSLKHAHPIPGKSNQLVDFALAPIIDILGAGDRPLEQWRPGFSFLVIGAEGNEPAPNFAPLEGITGVDDVVDHEMVAIVRVWHEESGAVVVQKRVCLFFQERDGGFLGDLRVD